MKIYFITAKLDFVNSGGSIEEFDLTIRTLQKFGHQVTVVTTFSEANDLVEDLPYTIIEERIKARGLLGIQWGIYKILKKYQSKAEIFHLDGHNFLYGAGLYRRLGGKVPVSAFFNRELSFWPEDKSIFFKKYYPVPSLLKKFKKRVRTLVETMLGMPLANGLDLCSFITPMYQETYFRSGLKKAKSGFVLGDPIDLKGIMKKNNVTEHSYRDRNKSQGPFTILFSSRMAPNKGFDMLLTAFAKLKNKDNFRLILGGRGPEEKWVHKLIDSLGIKQYVELPGWVSKEQLFLYHKEADIFVQPEWRSEGMSISLLYALAFGLPAVYVDGGGLQWVAKDAALYYQRGNAADLANKIEQLADSYQLREELSKNCYQRIVSDQLNYEKQIKQLHQRLLKLVP
jgi:glycosyltransferase involved in cell wall biosynthesis